MPPSIFRTPDFSNQFPFPLEVRKIGIPLYLVSNNLLSKYQSDLCIQQSLPCLKLRMTGSLTWTNASRTVSSFLICIKKAFDTVHHEILLRKLEICGFDFPAVKWLRSYLCNRRQVCVVGDAVLSVRCYF